MCLGVGVVCVWLWCGVVAVGRVVVVVISPLNLGALWVVYLQVVRSVVMLWLVVNVVVVLVNGLLGVPLVHTRKARFVLA